MADGWKITGTYFEACNCQIVCPCFFLSPPTGGECTTLVVWHIDKGYFRDVALEGLNVAMAVHCQGHMAQVKWKVALYLDERATEAQKEALTRIYSGQVGGHPATLLAFVGEVLGIKSAAIDYRVEGKRRYLRISNLAEAEIEALAGIDGREVTIGNHPLCIAGQPGIAARSRRLSYRDHKLQWELSDRHAFFSAFTYEGP